MPDFDEVFAEQARASQRTEEQDSTMVPQSGSTVGEVLESLCNEDRSSGSTVTPRESPDEATATRIRAKSETFVAEKRETLRLRWPCHRAGLGWTDAQERSMHLREDLYTWLSNPPTLRCCPGSASRPAPPLCVVSSQTAFPAPRAADTSCASALQPTAHG